ncbi:MAG: thiamine pyrophosphate-dependent enzyme, partial [Candidatus Staskawiczbacteria bacterium]|nr:thiamine pyrophosphate-dependent enzyme [Candidatus Staskawiczbacteria bacterium]
GDDPSCHSSAQSEQNSRGYAYLSHVPILEPADPQECYDFTKLGFEISEKFNMPVILRTTTRVAHQRMPVSYEIRNPKSEIRKAGEFVKNPRQFSTMPPRVMEMKKELLEKLEKIKLFAEKSKINKVSGGQTSAKMGIVVSGVAYLYVLEAMKELGIDLPVLKVNMFYPLSEKIVGNFIKNLKKVLVVEELEGYLEKEIKAIAKDVNPKLEIYGKGGAPWALPEIGELNADKIGGAVAKLTGKKFKVQKQKITDVPKRHSRFCEGCPHVFSLAAIKRAAPEGTILGGDIGCYMMAGLEPFNMQDYLFSMASSMGISHGVKKATKQKVISLIGDATFFHSGISGLINAVYNKSSPLFIILDNRTTAMTGNEPNPGMGKTGMGEDSQELKIEEIAKACGVKNIKVLDPINAKELEDTVKDFLEKDDVSVIICRRICKLLENRQKNG